MIVQPSLNADFTACAAEGRAEILARRVANRQPKTKNQKPTTNKRTRGGTRTHTALRPTVFETVASTDSATRAKCCGIMQPACFGPHDTARMIHARSSVSLKIS